MGTLIEITVSSENPRVDIYNSIDAAFSEFDQVVDKFSRFNSSSELSKLNKNSGTWHKVSNELFSLISKSMELTKLTQGLFDPTVIDLLRAYGYDKSYDEARIAKQLGTKSFQNQMAQIRKNRPSPMEIKLDSAKKMIKLKKNQNIDLGASGKGYAIDLAAKSLQTDGYQDFLINAGGDIWANSKKVIALFDPRSPQKPLGQIILKDQAIASSGSYAKRVGMFHHIINSINAKPEEKCLQTYVIAQSSLQADLLATTLFLLGKEGIELVHAQKAKALVITDTNIYGDRDLIS